jgi:hypothetical protein
MRLTGLPLIITTAVLGLLVIAATVLLWSRFGRWRLLTRTLGVVLAEALVVATVGLIANRSEEFYPSWQALRGDTGTTSSTAPPPAGRLDALLAGGRSTLPWRPASLASWHLATTPTVLLPRDYRDRPSTTYPVVLVLAGSTAEASAAAAAHADGVVTVVATPTAATTVAALGRMGVALGEDVRVTGYGWGLVASSGSASLAAGLVDSAPARFAGEALIGRGARPAGSVAFAVVRTVPGKPSPPGKLSPSGKALPPERLLPSGKAVAPGRPGKPGKVAPQAPATSLTCPAGSVWIVAARWAAAQTGQPLQPAVRLPVGAHSAGGAPPGEPPAGSHSAGRLPVGGHPTGPQPAGGR